MPFFLVYLDDGLVAGDTLLISQGLQAIQQVARLVGLTLSLDKCELVGVGPTLSAANFPAQLLADIYGNSLYFASLICWGLPLAPLTLLLGIPYPAVGTNRQGGFGYNRVVARPASWSPLVASMHWALRPRPQPALQLSSGAAASFAAI